MKHDSACKIEYKDGPVWISVCQKKQTEAAVHLLAESTLTNSQIPVQRQGERERERFLEKKSQRETIPNWTLVYARCSHSQRIAQICSSWCPLSKSDNGFCLLGQHCLPRNFSACVFCIHGEVLVSFSSQDG